jgi:hypothetical protein
VNDVKKPKQIWTVMRMLVKIWRSMIFHLLISWTMMSMHNCVSDIGGPKITWLD